MDSTLKDILQDLQRLQALADTELLDSPAEEAFDRLTRLACQVLDAPVALVSLVDSDRQFFKSTQGIDIRETPLTHSFCQHVVGSGEPLVVADARLDELVKDNLAITDLNVISYLGIPLKNDEGQGLGSFCVIDTKPREWTEQEIEIMKVLAASVTTEIRLRLEVRAREKINEDLQQRNEALDAFSHTVSHNLKNPIASIIGWASLARKYADGTSKEEMLETIRVIEETAKHTNNIIEALLLLAGLGRENIEPEPVPMHEVIVDALFRVSHLISERRAVIELPDELPMSVGYAPWLEELWVNYISNAIKYGGDPPRVTFGADELDGGRVRFWIKDNGAGISPEQQEKLFMPFSRLQPSAEIEGHGLGLAIVRQIIEQLEGDVGVESEVGQGSTFWFTLPCA